MPDAVVADVHAVAVTCGIPINLRQDTESEVIEALQLSA